MKTQKEHAKSKETNSSKPRSLIKIPSTSDSSPKLEELLPENGHIFLNKNSKNGSSNHLDRQASIIPIQYCHRHDIKESPSHPIKQPLPKNNVENQQQGQYLKGKTPSKDKLQISESGCSSLIQSSESGSSNGESSNDSSSESSLEEDISENCNVQTTQFQKKRKQREEQKYPLQLVCVEVECIENDKICCAKCLRYGPHEGHEAICLKTLSQQIQMAMKTGGKLGQFSASKIENQFAKIISSISQCQVTFLEQFNLAYENLQEESIKAIAQEPELQQQVKVWKAFFQPEKSDLMTHLCFINEQTNKYLNLLNSHIQNINPSKLLQVKSLSQHDITFQNQLKAVEEELKKAQEHLSTLAHHSIDVLPAFEFRNLELENLQSVAVKKFEYEERIEFSQVNKQGEPQGRNLIFWNDGAFRIGYNSAGLSQGICRMVWENGNFYEGTYVNDRKDGQGSFVKFSDNSSYFGQFKHDQKAGQGIEYYSNKSYYTGSFKHWKKHGEGKLLDSITNQVMKQGIWKNGKFISDLPITDNCEKQ